MVQSYAQRSRILRERLAAYYTASSVDIDVSGGLDASGDYILLNDGGSPQAIVQVNASIQYSLVNNPVYGVIPVNPVSSYNVTQDKPTGDTFIVTVKSNSCYNCIPPTTVAPHIPIPPTTTVALPPPLRDYASMAYDSSSNQIILFGGQNINYLSDTWSWVASSGWSQLDTPALLTPRSRMSMAYDPISKQIILFGGYFYIHLPLTIIYLNETWAWTASSGWSQLVTNTSLTPRRAMSMTYDPISQQLILFGGENDTGFLNETWGWTASAGWNLIPTLGPSARAYTSMAYDVLSSQLILFGGQGDNDYLNDTWGWTASAGWNLIPTLGPSARAYTSMAYDILSSKIILFGGVNDTGLLNDTWSWTASSGWIQIPTTTAPPKRLSATMVYDVLSSRIILFGGQIDNNYLNDTWSWSVSSGWAQLS